MLVVKGAPRHKGPAALRACFFRLREIHQRPCNNIVTKNVNMETKIGSQCDKVRIMAKHVEPGTPDRLAHAALNP